MREQESEEVLEYRAMLEYLDHAVYSVDSATLRIRSTLKGKTVLRNPERKAIKRDLAHINDYAQKLQKLTAHDATTT